jgi:hypothetical protein
MGFLDRLMSPGAQVAVDGSMTMIGEILAGVALVELGTLFAGIIWGYIGFANTLDGAGRATEAGARATGTRLGLYALMAVPPAELAHLSANDLLPLVRERQEWTTSIRQAGAYGPEGVERNLRAGIQSVVRAYNELLHQSIAYIRTEASNIPPESVQQIRVRLRDILFDQTTARLNSSR